MTGSNDRSLSSRGPGTSKQVIRQDGSKTMKGHVRMNINRLAKIEHYAVPVKRDEKFFPPKGNQLIKDTDEKSD